MVFGTTFNRSFGCDIIGILTNVAEGDNRKTPHCKDAEEILSKTSFLYAQPDELRDRKHRLFLDL